MRPRTFAVAPLLFGSGLCALVYQTVWLGVFRLIFRASTDASGAVLGIFIGGLVIGCVRLANPGEPARRPLGLYANLQFVIAASAAVAPLLGSFVRYFYSSLCASQL